MGKLIYSGGRTGDQRRGSDKKSRCGGAQQYRGSQKRISRVKPEVAVKSESKTKQRRLGITSLDSIDVLLEKCTLHMFSSRCKLFLSKDSIL